MVGDKLKRIISLYESASSGESDISCVCVHGQPGSGKTALLDKINNSMLMSGVNVFFYIESERHKKAHGEKHSDDAIRELLRQLLRINGAKIDQNFNSFVLSYINGTLGTDANQDFSQQYGKESLTKFIYGCVKAEPAVFIVDDLDNADAFTINLLGNLLEFNALQFIVISHSDKLDNTLLSDLLYRNTKIIEHVELQIDDNVKIKSPAGTPALDEALLVLSKPGRERQLITHYIKEADHYMKQMAYEKAASIYNDALDVCHKIIDTTDVSDIVMYEIDLHLSLGQAQIYEKQFEKAHKTCSLAFRLTDMKTQKSLPAEAFATLLEKRIAAAILTAQCCDKLNLAEQAREYIMIAESHFLSPQNRNRYYQLYSKHILHYLELLTEMDERLIFREKLKQAYSICTLDDEYFSCSLLCQEAYMYLATGDYAKSFELLTQARSTAAAENLLKIWDEATAALATCSEQLDKPELSTMLLTELIDKSNDPVKVAEAMINKAIMIFETDGDEKAASTAIQTGIELYSLTREDKILADIYEHLRYTPLAGYFIH